MRYLRVDHIPCSGRQSLHGANFGKRDFSMQALDSRVVKNTEEITKKEP